jgi:ABC-type spermidine/putrescine transport system permease subunit I
MHKNSVYRFIPILAFVLFYLCFLVAPVSFLIAKGLDPKTIAADFFWILNSGFLLIFLKSALIAFLTASICLVISYFISMCIFSKKHVMRSILSFLLIIPFATNFLIHVITIGNMLDTYGPLVYFFKSIGLVRENYTFLYTGFAVLFGFVYCYLPFAVFPIYNAISKFDDTLLKASCDLGASKFRSFFRVIVPTTSTAAYTAFFLVFVPSCGEFVIPELLGGDKNMFSGTVLSCSLLNPSTVKIGALMTLCFIFLLFVSCIFVYLVLSRFIKKLELI